MFKKKQKNGVDKSQGHLDHIKKRRRRRRISSLIILLLCLLLTFNFETLVSFARGIFNIGGVQFQMVHTFKYTSPEPPTTDLSLVKGQSVQSVGNRVLKAEGGKLQAYDVEGKLLWDKAFGGTRATFSAVGKRIFLVEQGSGDLFIMDESGNVKAKREGLGKIDRVIAKREDIVILYKKIDKKILVLDGKGQDVATITLPYAEIMDLDYAPDLNLIGVSVFFIEKDYFHTSVFLFGTDGKMRGARSFNNQILYRIYGYKDRFIGMSDQAVTAFNDKDKDLWTEPVDQIMNRIDHNQAGDQGFNLVIEDKVLEDTRAENAVAVISPEGKWRLNEKIGMVVDQLYLGDNRLALLGDSQITLMDFSGRVLGHKPVSTGLKQVLWIDDKNIGLAYADRFEWYRLSY